MSSAHATNIVKQSSDLYIRPSIDEFELFERKSLDRIAGAGCASAVEAIDVWQASASRAATATPAGV